MDAERGILFCGTGSAVADYYGGGRKGDNLFANCTLALDARTGKRLWHFQTVHHDLWDHDNPCPPVARDGEARRPARSDAVAQVTKTGYCFLFDRETGKPLFGVEETPAPPSDVPGEQAAPRSRSRVKPPPLSTQTFTEDDVTDISPEAHDFVLEQLKEIPPRRPPSTRRALQGRVAVPGFHGGATWVGGSFDPTTGLPLRQHQQRPVRLTRSKTAGPTGSYAVRRLRLLQRPRRLPRDQAAVGPAHRDRPEQGRVRLAGPARRIPRADRQGHPADRHRELRRHDRHRRRAGLHRRHQGREVPRLRQGHRQAALGLPASRRRLRDAVHLHGGRQAVRRHRRRRRRQAADEVGRCVCGLRTSVA